MVLSLAEIFRAKATVDSSLENFSVTCSYLEVRHTLLSIMPPHSPSTAAAAAADPPRHESTPCSCQQAGRACAPRCGGCSRPGGLTCGPWSAAGVQRGHIRPAGAQQRPAGAARGPHSRSLRGWAEACGRAICWGDHGECLLPGRAWEGRRRAATAGRAAAAQVVGGFEVVKGLYAQQNMLTATLRCQTRHGCPHLSQALLQEGNMRRKTDSTDANATSSRSHAVLEILVRRTGRHGYQNQARTEAGSWVPGGADCSDWQGCMVAHEVPPPASATLARPRSPSQLLCIGLRRP